MMTEVNDLCWASPSKSWFDNQGREWAFRGYGWACLESGDRQTKVEDGNLERFGPFTTERKDIMAISLTATRAQKKRELENLEQQLAEITAALGGVKADLKGLTPDEPAGQDTVVRFRKYSGVYTYAAIRVGDVWYLTQNPTRPQDRRFPMTWSELMAWIGERNWDTIEVLS